MNRARIKEYAPQARRDFIQAVTDRAAYYGLTASKVVPVEEKGDVAVISGREHPRSVAKKRRLLEDRVRVHGFDQTMEAVAYTWFNRLVAIRFMELHGYLEHGYRVLSHPEGKTTPQILEAAEHVELPGLDKQTVIELKLDGSKEGQLYRLLLIAQCNALHAAMPFLFEQIDDETELLVPDQLLHTDSLIRKLVRDIDEEDWQEVEIVGWLYQFYISEKKDEVIGRVVASEDIPAATQLFTPNWIVKYLVQNSLGRQWLATYPQSSLRHHMEYYIEPAEQSPEVQDQLKAIIPTSLNPEELTLLDPACGSGHILVEAYDLFKLIYQERGYRAKDIPTAILTKNLFGFEIDERAAQLAAFAVMMRARADDRHILDGEARPNILAFEDSRKLDAAQITRALNSPSSLLSEGHIAEGDVTSLLALFEDAKTCGSLTRVSRSLADRLPALQQRLDEVLERGELGHTATRVVRPLLRQALLLSRKYDVVVANPPYMGSMAFPAELRAFAKDAYPRSYSDLFSMFMDRATELAASGRYVALVVMQSWMFLTSLRTIREHILATKCLLSLAHLGARAFGTISGEIVQVAAFSLCNFAIRQNTPTFLRLTDGDEETKKTAFHRQENRFCRLRQEDFAKLPGSPLSYWATDAVADAFANGTPLKDFGTICNGIKTGNVSLFVRQWYEMNTQRVGFGFGSQDDAEMSGLEWFPYCKGGEFRKWYGNVEHVLHWEDRGERLRTYAPNGGVSNSRVRPENRPFFFKQGITWSAISSQEVVGRLLDAGLFFDISGPSLFPHRPDDLHYLIGFLCSSVAEHLLSCLNTTLNVLVQDIKVLPLLDLGLSTRRKVEAAVAECVTLSRSDWDAGETSWAFERSPLLREKEKRSTVAHDMKWWSEECERRIDRLHTLETSLNGLFSEAYGLSSQVAVEVPRERIGLYRCVRQEDTRRLVSYAVGCMMGRYSLDMPGLVYAQAKGTAFAPIQYVTFSADADGILPLTELDWGLSDDTARRFEEFVGVVWPKERLEENLAFLSESLGPTKGEQPRDTIRRYLAGGFYKHHLQMYKRRPIYWLFSSGKLRAFQCLVYLHRYHEGTLARMRTEYVIPLQGRIGSRIEQLEGDKAKATSTSHRSKLQKEQDALKKQSAELLAFDEKLKHFADQRISLDLDDGVKVNYAKFGDLLAEVKAVTGGGDE